MRRGLAGLFFFIAAILLAVAAGAWSFQRVAFDPTSSREVAQAVLEDAEIRGELAELIAGAAAPALAQDASQLGLRINGYAQNPAYAEVLSDVIADAHAHMIGAQAEPVQITGAQMVNIVRDQRVAELSPVTLPVNKVPMLNTIRGTLSWLVPITALAGLVALVLGVLAHPRRADALFGIGVFCILAAVLAMVLGYAVPAFVLPFLNDNLWMAVIPAIANEQLPRIGGLSVGLAIVGVVLIMASVGLRGRKSKSWSSPVRVARYSEQRHWS